MNGSVDYFVFRLKCAFFCFGLVFTGIVSLAQETPMLNKPGNPDTVIAGFHPTAGSDQYYRIYVGAFYSIIKHRHNKIPYAASHTIGLNYSLSENSFHPYYENFFPQIVGNWGLSFKVGYDGIRRINYFGMGNETKRENRDIRYNWVRSHQQYASLGLGQSFAKYHRINWSLSYNAVKILDDADRYIAKSRGTIDPAEFNWQYFLGSSLNYTYSNLDNAAFPNKGVTFNSSVAYTENLKRNGHSFTRYSVSAEAFIPLPSSFSFVAGIGIATLSGNPDFYQYNTIGGTGSLRGFHNWRFYGKTAFYEQNEVRWIRPVETNRVSGRLGFLLFYDIGRVWLPGESSSKLHFGYGPGIIVAPFDKFVATAALGISNEDKRFHFSLGKMF